MKVAEMRGAPQDSDSRAQDALEGPRSARAFGGTAVRGRHPQSATRVRLAAARGGITAYPPFMPHIVRENNWRCDADRVVVP